MKLFFKTIVTILCYLLINNTIATAQCPAGETEITFQFSYTDNYDFLIEWDYIAGGVLSGNGPYNKDDIITACVPDGDLIIVGCDDSFGMGWYFTNFVLTITEDGSVNGCGAQNGCTIFTSNGSVIPYLDCYGTPPTEELAQLTVGPCDNSPVLDMGCTDPAAPNYNVCAITDDGSCILTTSNDSSAPPNDFCENATPICGPTNGTLFNATLDTNEPLLSDCFSYGQTSSVWFSFEADGSDNPITFDVNTNNCYYYISNPLDVIIYSGTCGGPYTEEACASYYYYYTYSVSLPNPVVGETYFLYINSLNYGYLGYEDCGFTIQPSGGIQACCGPDFSLSTTCQLGNESDFFVDVEILDLGDNPSGYSINGGAFPNITSIGTTTIGPFPNGTATITIEGLDNTSCVKTRFVENDCSCDTLAVTASEDGLICEGETYDASVTLAEVIPSAFAGTYVVTTSPPGSCTVVPTGEITEIFLENDDFSPPIPFGFNFNYWENTYTDFYIGSNGYVTLGQGSIEFSGDPIPNQSFPNNIIALFWTGLVPTADGTISYFNATVGTQNCMVAEFDQIQYCCNADITENITGQIIMCEDGTIILNCIDCQTYPIYQAYSGIENIDGTAGYFDPALTNGQYLDTESYMACTTFTPEITEPSACNFLYWVTDLNDPTGSIVSTNETTTFSPSVTTTYYAVVECEDGLQCVDEVTVTIDDPVNCGDPPICEDEIAGSVQTDEPACSLEGIMVLITDSIGNAVGVAITDVNGDYLLSGGPYPCGEYMAALDVSSVPMCYTNAEGEVGPTGFTINGDGVPDGANFSSFNEVPTLSQWGLIILVLLLMNFGALNMLPLTAHIRRKCTVN